MFATFVFCLQHSFFVCSVSFICSSRFLFAAYFFICSVSFLFAAFLFCLQRYFFVCSVSFLFAAFLFCLQRFFFVCSMSLVGHRSLSMAHANTLIFISIGDTKDIFCFNLQSVDSERQLVCFCSLFKFYRLRHVRIIIRRTHIYLRFPQTFLLQLMKMLKLMLL